jgi:transcriptional regulator with XRE-family HTH domain
VELEQIGRRVQDVRRARTDLSQTDLALAVGVSWPTISRLERGIGQSVNLERLRMIAEVLGVTIDELLYDPDRQLA